MKKLLLTPMQFYKRFGHESSRMYAKGIFLIVDMFEEWRVDKGELFEIIASVEHINNGAIEELKEIIEDHEDDSCLYELMYTNELGVYDIDYIKKELNCLLTIKSQIK